MWHWIVYLNLVQNKMNFNTRILSQFHFGAVHHKTTFSAAATDEFSGFFGWVGCSKLPVGVNEVVCLYMQLHKMGSGSSGF